MLPLSAGPETSVAATKSYIASLVGRRCTWSPPWSEDAELLGALALLPDQLQRAWKLDWTRGGSRCASAREPLS